MMALCYWYAKRHNYPVEEVFQWKKVKSTFKDAAWAFLLPVIILGGIFGGLVTATEGAALAVLAALFIGGVIYRELDLAASVRSDDRRRHADRHRDAARRQRRRCWACT
jgi:C4-dicarboxylate transporter DctM subunit